MTVLGIVRTVLVIALACVTSSSGAGDFASVRELPYEVKVVRKGRLSNADITLLNVRIGRETIAQVRSRFGAAESFRNPPQGASSDVEICYASQRGGQSLWVIFGSGAMGGWETVTHFQVLSKPPNGAPCASSPLGTRPIATNSGIRLGMQIKSLRAMLGQPTESGVGYEVFGFEQKSDHPKRPEFDMLSVLSATTTTDRVTSFHASLIESN